MIYIIQSIKADIYRLSKSKGMWIASLFLVIFILTSVSGSALGSIGSSGMEQAVELEGIREIAWTSDIAIRAMLSQIQILSYILIIVPVTVIGADFKNKSYKNVITTGISRTQYFISKMITILLVSFAYTVFFLGLSALVGGILNGVGDVFVSEVFMELLKISLMKFFFLYATLLIGLIAICLTQNTITMTLSILFVPIIIQLALIIFELQDSFLKYIDIGTASAIVGLFDSVNALPYFIGSSALIAGFSLISIQVFKNKDL